MQNFSPIRCFSWELMFLYVTSLSSHVCTFHAFDIKRDCCPSISIVQLFFALFFDWVSLSFTSQSPFLFVVVVFCQWWLNPFLVHFSRWIWDAAGMGFHLFPLFTLRLLPLSILFFLFSSFFFTSFWKKSFFPLFFVNRTRALTWRDIVVLCLTAIQRGHTASDGWDGEWQTNVSFEVVTYWLTRSYLNSSEYPKGSSESHPKSLSPHSPPVSPNNQSVS